MIKFGYPNRENVEKYTHEAFIEILKKSLESLKEKNITTYISEELKFNITEESEQVIDLALIFSVPIFLSHNNASLNKVKIQKIFLIAFSDNPHTPLGKNTHYSTGFSLLRSNSPSRVFFEIRNYLLDSFSL